MGWVWGGAGMKAVRRKGCGPTGRDEAQQGAGGAAEELKTEGRLCQGCSPRAPPHSWLGPVTPGASGALPATPFLQVSPMFLFWGHRLLELKVHLTGINI